MNDHPPSPDRPAPSPNEVLVWLLETVTAEPFFAHLRRLLSPDELGRASNFFRERSARRFVVNRGFLRLLLGRTLGVPPDRLVFSQEANGKPLLARTASPVAFNLSHTDRLAAFALSAGRRVGIDVETVREPADLEGVAKYVFPAAVAARLAALPEEGRRDRFFRLWTRLEAVAKACGLGLGGLPGLKAAELDGEPPPVIDFEGSRWRVIDLDLELPLLTARDHRAALCLEGDDCRTVLSIVDASLLRAWIADSLEI